jgi:hypothetical protein
MVIDQNTFFNDDKSSLESSSRDKENDALLNIYLIECSSYNHAMITNMYIGSYLSGFNGRMVADKYIVSYFLRIIGKMTYKMNQLTTFPSEKENKTK